MRTRIASLLVGVFALTASGQNSPPPQFAPDFKPLAVASIHVEKHRFKSGEDIGVVILLEAGPGGVYIPKSWGLSGGGMAGFSVSLTTLSGERAETCGFAADAWPKHEPDAKVALNRDFVYLPDGQVIGLRTSVMCPTKRSGRYLISGRYSPYHIDAHEVAQLPETRGRVLREALQAKPVAISIY